MDKAPNNAVWFVVTAFIAAAGGAFLGVTVAPNGVVTSPEEPSNPSADTRELVAAIRRLREDLRDTSEDALAQPAPVVTERRPMESGISTDVEELRALVAAIRGLVEDGNSVADPPPIAAFRSAGEKNLTAVREACTPGQFDVVHEALPPCVRLVAAWARGVPMHLTPALEYMPLRL